MTEWDSQLRAGAEALTAADPVLAEVIKNAPLPTLLPHKNYYQSLVESIISQQLSVKAAATILERFVALFPGGFPSPEEILDKDVEAYRAAGLSRQKAAYILDLAQKVIDGMIVFDHLDTLSNDEVINELVQVKGVGVWTVHMFLMFCMGRLDVLPVGDLGIKNGIQRLYDFEIKPTEAEMTALAKANNWYPYESLASWYIWHSLNNKPAL